jgi:hypothetical protein
VATLTTEVTPHPTKKTTVSSDLRVAAVRDHANAATNMTNRGRPRLRSLSRALHRRVKPPQERTTLHVL